VGGVLGRVIYALLLAGVLVIAAWISFSKIVVGKSMRVPDMTGLSVDEATAIASERGLAIQVDPAHERYDDEVAVHRVAEQEPAAGTAVKSGQRVRVFLSLGPRMIRVPDLAGASARTASLALSREGLRAGVESAARLDAAVGVAGQGILPGTTASPEAKVDFLVNRGMPDIAYVMPDLIGRDFDRVRQAFETRGFRIGGVKSQVYEGAAAGTILRQFPLAGYPVTYRDTLSFVVASSETP
jgi:serine/threonine-protein kinase